MFKVCAANTVSAMEEEELDFEEEEEPTPAPTKKRSMRAGARTPELTSLQQHYPRSVSPTSYSTPSLALYSSVAPPIGFLLSHCAPYSAFLQLQAASN